MKRTLVQTRTLSTRSSKFSEKRVLVYDPHRPSIVKGLQRIALCTAGPLLSWSTFQAEFSFLSLVSYHLALFFFFIIENEGKFNKPGYLGEDRECSLEPSLSLPRSPKIYTYTRHFNSRAPSHRHNRLFFFFLALPRMYVRWGDFYLFSSSFFPTPFFLPAIIIAVAGGGGGEDARRRTFLKDALLCFREKVERCECRRVGSRGMNRT